MKENEKEAETDGDLHLEPPPVIDVDGKDVSDEDNDSTFGSEFDIAAELDSDDEPMNTTGTNIPHFPVTSLSPSDPSKRFDWNSYSAPICTPQLYHYHSSNSGNSRIFDSWQGRIR